MSFFSTAALFSDAAPAPADSAGAVAASAVSWYQSAGLINAAIFIALVIVSAFLGRVLAKAMRVADYGTKFGIILFALLASIVVIVRGWPPKLGVDLGGGSILVYQVNQTKKTDWDPSQLDSLVASITKRVNPGGQKEISVRSVGTNMVEIVMPSVSGSSVQEKQAESDEIKKIIRSTGALEFCIVANNRDNESLIEKAKLERKKFPAEPSAPIVVEEGGHRAKWCRIRDEEADKLKNEPAAMPVGEVTEKDKEGNPVEKERYEMLVLLPDSDATKVTGEDVSDARAATNTETGGPEVSFSFKPVGGARFGKLTGDHVPVNDFQYQLAIVLDDVLETAPNIQSAITDNGRITGNFTQQQVKGIVDIINAGSLPAALAETPVRDMTTGATLGADTIHQSTHAMIIAAIAVPLFMIIYYHFAGVVAVLELSLNMLMLVALMILIKAPFTLSALAGLALSVGMAVDNNVLIYERLREEIAHGAALRMAIRNSFHRVGVVIIDANITHLIAATVLWAVGTEQIKGFAVTFWLGAVLSIWATMFVARVMFEVAERRRWVTKMTMMQWIGHTKIDFMAWFPACATFSVLITVLGIVVAVVRGHGLFDIDFTGGISVQTVFRQEQRIDDLRAKVDAVSNDLPDATVTPAQSQGEPNNTRFIIDTSNSKRESVEAILKQLFGDELVSVEVSSKPIKSEKPPVSPGIMSPGQVGPGATGPGAAVPGAKGTAEKPTSPSLTGRPSTGPPEEKTSKDLSKPKSSAAAPSDAAPSSGTTSISAPPSAPTSPAPSSSAAPSPAPKASSSPAPKQSRSELPGWNLLAMVGDDAVLLAQADSAAKAAVAQPAPADSAKLPADSDGVPPGNPRAAVVDGIPAKAVTPAPAKPAPADNAKSKSTTLEEKPSDPPVDRSKPESTTTETTPPPPPETPSYRAVLTLSSTVPKLAADNVTATQKAESVGFDKDRLAKLIQQALDENKIPYDNNRVQIDLVAPGGSAATTKSGTWELTLTPNSETQSVLTPEKFQAVLATLKADMRSMPYFPNVDNIGSAVANEARFWAFVALGSSWILIILYLWIRFQGVAFGVAAVIALVHDVLVMLGAIAFSSYLAKIPGFSALTLIDPFKINLQIVAAFLTIIGYSVNDTIVVFDRIREIRGKSPTVTRKMVNDATNQMLSRTVLTSFTVLMVVVILYIFGGQAVHGFAFALIIGVLTGTYSSIYVAAPVLLWLMHPKEMSAFSSGK